MVYNKIVRRVAWLASTALLSVHSAQAQTLLDQYIPSNTQSSNPQYYQGGGNTVQPFTPNARDTATGVTVLTRPHPDYDALGVRLRSFLFNASLTEGFGYDSNPLGLSKNKGSSFLQTRGLFSAASNWGRNGISFDATVLNYQYFDVPKISHTDWSTTVGGFLDIGRDRLSASYSHLNLNVLPTSLDNRGNSSVIPFTVDQVIANYRTRFGRFSVIPQIEFASYKFNSGSTGLIFGSLFNNTAQTFAPTTVVNNFDVQNNRDVTTGGATVRYELSPGRDVVGIIRASTASFTNTLLGQLNRDYTNIQGLLGIDFQANAKLRYRVLGGYERRTYKSNAYRSRTSPTFEAQVIWSPTQRTTVTVTGSRRIEESIISGLNSFSYTTGRVQVDHELKRNVILTAYGQIQRADYNSNQNATIYNAGAAATWKLNRRLALVGSYEYLKRNSNAFNNYNEHLTLLQLKISL